MASSYLCHLYLRFSLPANLLAALTPKCVASTNTPGNTEPEVSAHKGQSARAETVSQICTLENGDNRSASAWLYTEEPAPLNRKQLFTCTSRTKVACLRTAAVDGLNHTTFSWDMNVSPKIEPSLSGLHMPRLAGDPSEQILMKQTILSI